MKNWKLGVAVPVVLAFGLALGLQAQQPRFNDHDRAAVHTWMSKHHDHPPVGFRESDRLTATEEARLQVGVVLEPAMRRRIHPVPHDLLVTLAPAPRHYRYVVIGDHVCLVDAGYHVTDILHLELNF